MQGRGHVRARHRARLLHAKDESPIDYKRVCEEEGIEVPWREIVKDYLASAGPAAAKPYALLRDALEQSGRVGIGTIVMRQREHLASVAPAGEALVLTTMRWAYEIRSTHGLGLPGRATSRDRRELDLALRLVDTLASDWDPRRYKDTYRDVLMDVIERKAVGKEIHAPKPERPAKVRSLTTALEASLRERRPGARAAGRRPHRRAA